MLKLAQQALWVDSMGYFPMSPAIVKACTFKDKFGSDYCLAVPMQDKVLVPRNMLSSYASDRRVVAPVATPIPCEAPPRDADQDRCIKESVALLKQGINHVLQAPTGWGKSYAGVKICSELGQKTLILVTKSDLIGSWMKNLNQVAGIPLNRIGLVKGTSMDWKGKDIVIATVQSVARVNKDGKNKMPDEFFDYFGFVMQDEVHRIGAEFFMRCMTLLKAKIRLGLSATPKRADGRMVAIEAHIGAVMVIGKNIPMIPKALIVRTGWKVPKVATDTGQKLHYAAGKMASATKEMGMSKERNNVIIDFVKQAYDSGRHIIIMSDQIEGHLKILYSLCLDAGINAMDMGFYIGGLKTQADRDLQANKRIVFATYQMCSEGTDYPSWDTLVQATPRADVEQIVGRILRLLKGKRQPVTLDLVDDNAILKGYATSRLKYYFKVGATIVNMN